MAEKLVPWEKALSHTLVSDNIISQTQSKQAQGLARVEGITLDEAVLKLGVVEDSAILPIVAATLDIPYYKDLIPQEVDHKTLADLSLTYCQSNTIAPIFARDDEQFILTATPSRKEHLDEVSFVLGRQIDVCVAPSRVIRKLLRETANPTTIETQTPAGENKLRQETDGPVIRFVAHLLEDAVAQGASDLHFESLENGLRVRLRVHGVLHSFPIDSALSPAAILARIKVMANMNVSERRLPQDGRITTAISGRKVDFRVSSVPTSFGESIVCRILDPKAVRLGWNKLGFDQGLSLSVQNIVEQPSGLFLVTGPTGSGKTTTLYTALSHLNTEGRKILTVEDPVEYNLTGVEQVQIHEEIGMSFARALRAFLRQDPNIIMVGEIRDEETAEIACRAALVGRMVLSTLHTNSPEGAVTRLQDLGVPTYIIRDVLRGVLGQQLEIVSATERKLSARLVAGRDLEACFNGD